MIELSQVLEMVKLVKHHILLGRIYCEGGAQEGRREGAKTVSNGIYAAQWGQEGSDGQVPCVGVVHPG